jgi:hypothetical protein
MGQPHHGEKRCVMNVSSMTAHTGLKESTREHGGGKGETNIYITTCLRYPHPNSTSADQQASQPACLLPPHSHCIFSP